MGSRGTLSKAHFPHVAQGVSPCLWGTEPGPGPAFQTSPRFLTSAGHCSPPQGSTIRAQAGIWSWPCRGLAGNCHALGLQLRHGVTSDPFWAALTCWVTWCPAHSQEVPAHGWATGRQGLHHGQGRRGYARGEGPASSQWLPAVPALVNPSVWGGTSMLLQWHVRGRLLPGSPTNAHKLDLDLLNGSGLPLPPR